MTVDGENNETRLAQTVKEALHVALGRTTDDPVQYRRIASALTAVDELARVSREAEQLREAVENLCEDVDEALRLDETLPAEKHRLGGILLGYGGGHNHLEDLRAALAAAGDRQEP